MENNWTNKYLINIKEIDEQHTVFFELWENECRMHNQKNQVELENIIEKLIDYIKMHFTYEEELLKQSGYENIEKHKTEHRFFIQKVDEMKQELKYMNSLLFEKTSVFMKKWFLSHIMVSDKEYAEAIKH